MEVDRARGGPAAGGRSAAELGKRSCPPQPFKVRSSPQSRPVWSAVPGRAAASWPGPSLPDDLGGRCVMADTRRQTTAGQGAPGGGPGGRPGASGLDVRSRAGRLKMSGGSWLAAGKRTVREFGDDALTDHCCRADLLRGAVDLPRAAGRGIPAGPGRQVGNPTADHQPRPRRTGGSQADLPARGPGICKAARPPPVALRSSASSLRCGPHRAISRPSCVPLTSSTTCQKAGRSGRPHRCAWALPC